MQATLKTNQTLADFATQHTGRLEGWWQVAAEAGLSLTSDVAPGAVLRIVTLDARVAGFFRENPLLDIVGGPQYNAPGGIDYMEIGNTFIVS